MARKAARADDGAGDDEDHGKAIARLAGLGRMNQSCDFTFKGRIVCDSFRAFAEHRARRLSLGLEIGPCSGEAVTVNVKGAEALIDMFEMACSLGPFDCIILDVVRADAPWPRHS